MKECLLLTGAVPEMLSVLRTLLAGLVDSKRAMRLLGVGVSGLVTQDELRGARQVVTPSLWPEGYERP